MNGSPNHNHIAVLDSYLHEARNELAMMTPEFKHFAQAKVDALEAARLLLSSHGGGGEAVAWTDDAENFGNALNEAAWTFTEHCPEKSARLFNNTKVPLRLAILKYASMVSRTAPPPQPRAEGMAWPAGVLNRDKTLEVLTSHNAWRRGAKGPQTDPRLLGLALDAAIAALATAPGEGRGEPEIGCDDHDHARYIPGCVKCASTLPKKSRTPPPASQSATPLDELPEAVRDACDDILNRLEGWASAYPLTAFPEPTKEQREWIHATAPGLMDRISASMGRHMAGCIAEDLAKLKAALNGGRP